MTSIGAQVQIHCPIGLFERQEAKIDVLTKAINAAQTASEKAPNARMLSEEVNVLLDCASYDQTNASCRLCRNFAKLRLRTASLIVKLGAGDALR